MGLTLLAKINVFQRAGTAGHAEAAFHLACRHAGTWVEDQQVSTTMQLSDSIVAIFSVRSYGTLASSVSRLFGRRVYRPIVQTLRDLLSSRGGQRVSRRIICAPLLVSTNDLASTYTRHSLEVVA